MTPGPDSLFMRRLRDDDSSDGGEDDDDISITSTVNEGGDFDVEQLLAERPKPDNPDEIEYLIKWEGYPLEECTVSQEASHHSLPCLEIDG